MWSARLRQYHVRPRVIRVPEETILRAAAEGIFVGQFSGTHVEVGEPRDVGNFIA